MKSTRLPGKVLKPIQGMSVMEIILRRLGRCRTLDHIIVVTSTEPEDDILADAVADWGVPCFRGSETDVLDRYYQAASLHGVGHIVRITGDCPLIDPGIVDRVVTEYHRKGFDLVSNCLSDTYPDGLDIWIFSFDSLRAAWQQAVLPSDREHVTPWIIRQGHAGGSMAVLDLPCAENLAGERWTLDEPEDYRFFLALADALAIPLVDADWREVLGTVRRHSRIRTINNHIRRNEGYERSLEQDHV